MPSRSGRSQEVIRQPRSGLAELVGPWLPTRRVWVATFDGHDIRVEARGFLRAKLFVDGQCRDRRTPLVANDRTLPLLSAHIPDRKAVIVVEVYFNVPFATRVGLRIGGKRVEAIEAL